MLSLNDNKHFVLVVMRYPWLHVRSQITHHSCYETHYGGGEKQLNAEKREQLNHVTTLHRRSLPASVHVGTLRHLSALSSLHSPFKRCIKLSGKSTSNVKTSLFIFIRPKSCCILKAVWRRSASLTDDKDVFREDVHPSTRSSRPVKGEAANGSTPSGSRTSCFSAVYQRVRNVTSAFSATLPARERQRRPCTQSPRKR